MLKCTAVCVSVFRCVTVRNPSNQRETLSVLTLLQGVAVYLCVLQCNAVCCNLLQCVAVCCNALVRV